MTTYAEKLKDPRWQKKRLQVLERDNWTCQECGSINDYFTNIENGKQEKTDAFVNAIRSFKNNKAALVDGGQWFDD